MSLPRRRNARVPGWQGTICVLLALAGGGGACAGRTARRAHLDRGALGSRDDDPARRAEALVSRLTIEEKVAQLQNHAPSIDRLGIPAYDWWSEALHGVARNGRATVFPQAIALAATFDEELMGRVARAIAEEARAKFQAAEANVKGSGRYEGLTFFAPNINIFRDPRWGRGQETYGEDPFLTARLAVAYVRGMQGDDAGALRVAAVAKHFAVHSGPELGRHRFDAHVDAHDLADTYLPQFEAVVREGRVAGIMAAYNRVNGEACVASPALLGKTLRQSWGFAGFVVGDCGAVHDVASGHKLVSDELHAAAAALRAGTDLDCGSTYRRLTDALRSGLVTEAEIDRAVARLFAVRFRLGLFDGTPSPARGGAPAVEAVIASHRSLAREAAQKSLVLLSNDGVLPLRVGLRNIAVVGPLADDVDVLLGNYHGDSKSPVTVRAGIAAAAQARGISVWHAPGVSLAGRSLAGLGAAVALARGADVVVAVLGLSPLLEGEEGDPDGGANPAGDRRDLALPPAQVALLRAVLDTGKPTVVVLTGGSAVALHEKGRAPGAVVMAWYPGEEGGNAVADVLFGDVSPSGRLPVTFYRSVADLPPFTSYAMQGRTYRYFSGKLLFPFGHGLGYQTVRYRDVRTKVSQAVTDAGSTGSTGSQAPVASPRDAGADASPQSTEVRAGTPLVLQVTVENAGDRSTDEVIQVFASARPRLAEDPLRALVGFGRVTLAGHQTRVVDVTLSERAFTRVDRQGTRRFVAGAWDLAVGDLVATVSVAAVP